MTKQEMINQLRENRAQLKREMDNLMAAPEKHGRALSVNERKRFNELEGQMLEINERDQELSDQLAADISAGQVARKYAPYGNGVTGEPQVYRKNGQVSYFRDLYNARTKGDRDAADRLQRNNQMVADTKGHDAETRALTTVNGVGGEWVPPKWMEDDFVRFVRAGRITANLATANPLPPGTDSINLPKINTGTATAVQATQNTGVQNTDLSTTAVSSGVTTIAGGQTVSLQLMEQSPLNIDTVILQDLAADHAKQIDLQILSGTGSAGQVLGLFTLAGTNAITWTQASPALGGAGGMYAKLASAMSSIHTARFMPATAIVMHPRRWAWAEAQADSTGRPLIVPTAGGPMNVAALQTDVVAEGSVGIMLGLPVFLDANIPVNGGAGTNQDSILVLRNSDQWIFEGDIRAEAFQQTYASQMSVFCRLYSYLAYIPGRYPQSISIIQGSGLVTPTF
ncbi:phage major capsid protein [Streptomyces sp. H10-C2]|uniref:phage major capsid protein n=1 Tax=unclassified Streptomyces TaxID=2593676 RepID=UPI0024B8793E|nr:MULTISPECIES: phage major capsid protein [unclassified Streptomyces]MDJ0345957.1 phage major capsid protein [Streptomyces sp. PH10-H1]MDJ0373876.1 phage major capsid protein [Streptomyces sp. H10-C2]